MCDAFTFPGHLATLGARWAVTARNWVSLLEVSNLLASLGHTGRRRVVLGHTLNTHTLMKTAEQKIKKVLSKFTILCWLHSWFSWAVGRITLVCLGKSRIPMQGSWRSPDWRGQGGQSLWEEVCKYQKPMEALVTGDERKVWKPGRLSPKRWWRAALLV